MYLKVEVENILACLKGLFACCDEHVAIKGQFLDRFYEFAELMSPTEDTQLIVNSSMKGLPATNESGWTYLTKLLPPGV